VTTLTRYPIPSPKRMPTLVARVRSCAHVGGGCFPVPICGRVCACVCACARAVLLPVLLCPWQHKQLLTELESKLAAADGACEKYEVKFSEASKTVRLRRAPHASLRLACVLCGVVPCKLPACLPLWLCCAAERAEGWHSQPFLPHRLQ
jgi:hypothetical protein